VTRADLDRLLEHADRASELQHRLDRARRLEAEIRDDAAVDRAVPTLVEAIHRSQAVIAGIARELEREWVAQGPLVSNWQRAVELAQVAEAAGADASGSRAEAADARARVESAQLATRDHREALAAERQRLVDALLQLPVELDPPPPVRVDGRPEAVRRDAMAFLQLGDVASEAAERARGEACERLEEARARLAELGSAAALEQELCRHRAQLPPAVELPGDAPPSAALRLRRAGVEVAGLAVE
jgi:hypothetical protein